MPECGEVTGIGSAATTNPIGRQFEWQHHAKSRNELSLRMGFHASSLGLTQTQATRHGDQTSDKRIVCRWHNQHPALQTGFKSQNNCSSSSSACAKSG
jgi:hypothetical protein